MIPIRRMGATPLVLSLALFAGCATAAGYYDNPPPAMTGKPCSDLPVDKAASMNPVGWVHTMPTPGQSIVCGSKYASGAFFCSEPGKCGELSYSTVPGERDRGKTWHFVLDLYKGKVTACAEAANRFGYHDVDCKPVEMSATMDKPVRQVFEVVVPPLLPGSSEQTATTIMLSVKAAGSGDVIVGQIGPVEQPTP